MSEEVAGRGELAVPHPASATLLDRLHGTAVAGTWIRPDGADGILNSSVSPLSLLRALRRRLPSALGLAILASSASLTAAWFLVPQAKFRAKSLLKVDSQTPRILYKVENPGGEDYKRYQKTQVNLLKSRVVLSSALSSEGISKLPMIRDLPDQLAWLQENVEAQFLGESELMEISLGGDRPEDLKRIVNAVTAAFMDEIVLKEGKEKAGRLETLKKLSKTYTDMKKTRRDTIRKLAQQAGSDDKQTLILQKQFAMEHLASLRRELAEVESQKRKAEAVLRARRPGSLQETSAPLASGSEVDRLVDQDPGVNGLSQKLADMEQRLALESSHSRQVARNSAMDPVAKTLRDEVASLRAALAKKRGVVRRLVIRELQNPETGADVLKGDPNRQQLAILEDIEGRIKSEIEKDSKNDEKLTDDTLDLQDYQDDLAQIQQAAAKIDSEVEMLNVELQARSRIMKIEDAETPSSRDERKRFLMIGVITLGSFMGTLLGIAFLELQARRVDSVDEVMVDLGLPVVGALPMLPSKTRNSGAPRRTEKDRYWYNLLLESVDATRTMLVHAARLGNDRVVMIASALPGEGKTSLASHLATSLARSGRKTLLIDADLRSPSIHRLFELTQDPGLSELLRAESGLEDVLASTAVEELSVITAGRCDSRTMRILAQGGLAGLFDRLRELYDFVIVDTSPVLPVSDALLVAQQCDAVLFSILRDVSRKAKIFAAYQRLSALRVKVLGAVVTGEHDGRYSKAYYPSNIYDGPCGSAESPGETGTGSIS
jgi:capsular exopolysaccharide synthesis family protein